MLAKQAGFYDWMSAGDYLRWVASLYQIKRVQAGAYRVLISVVDRETGHVMTSPFVDFQVRRKPVVESERILPVAFGVPALVLGVMTWRRYRRRAG